MTLPTRTQLHTAMRSRFRNHEYIDTVLAQCAEVAEQIFNRARLEHYNHAPKPVVVLSHRYYPTRHRNKRPTGYQCPACKTSRIHADHSFCPACGVQIEWEQPYTTIQKAA